MYLAQPGHRHADTGKRARCRAVGNRGVAQRRPDGVKLPLHAPQAVMQPMSHCHTLRAGEMMRIIEQRPYGDQALACLAKRGHDQRDGGGTL